MVAFELEGVEVDRCVVCGGTWLDAGELEMIAGLSGVEVDGLVRALADAKSARGGRRGEGWQSFRCRCGKVHQLSPGFHLSFMVCRSCRTKIKILDR